MIGPQSASSDLQVFWRSVGLVGFAELFDKTWFMGLLLALRYPPSIVFVGSFLALFLHCFFAAAFGLAFARLIPQHVLNYLAAGLFVFFAGLYAKDWYFADPDGDAIAAGREEAAEDCGLDDTEDAPSQNGNVDPDIVGKTGEEGDAGGDVQAGEDECLVENGEGSSKVADSSAAPAKKVASPAQKAQSSWKTALTKSFIGVFIAEWGDRTQIAMIGQHASQPLVPVFLGSAVAFFLLTISAVGVASVANQLKLSERMVHALGACSFGLFAVLALKDAISATPHAQ